MNRRLRLIVMVPIGLVKKPEDCCSLMVQNNSVNLMPEGYCYAEELNMKVMKTLAEELIACFRWACWEEYTSAGFAVHVRDLFVDLFAVEEQLAVV